MRSLQPQSEQGIHERLKRLSDFFRESSRTNQEEIPPDHSFSLRSGREMPVVTDDAEREDQEKMLTIKQVAKLVPETPDISLSACD
jgi:hypothetical protein